MNSTIMFRLVFPTWGEAVPEDLPSRVLGTRLVQFALLLGGVWLRRIPDSINFSLILE